VEHLLLDEAPRGRVVAERRLVRRGRGDDPEVCAEDDRVAGERAHSSTQNPLGDR